jgi:hypothetical protein
VAWKRQVKSSEKRREVGERSPANTPTLQEDTTRASSGWVTSAQVVCNSPVCRRRAGRSVGRMEGAQRQEKPKPHLRVPRSPLLHDQTDETGQHNARRILLDMGNIPSGVAVVWEPLGGKPRREQGAYRLGLGS